MARYIILQDFDGFSYGYVYTHTHTEWEFMRRRISKDAYRVVGYSRTDSQGEYINLALNKEGKSRSETER